MPRRKFVVLKSLRLEDIASGIPSNIFPMSLKIECTRTQEKDKVIADDSNSKFRPPERCFPLKLSKQLPYIPPKRIWFTNPLERPNLSKKDRSEDTWYDYDKTFDFEDFSGDLSKAYSIISDVHPPSRKRIYLGDLSLTVIPEEYAMERNNGKRGWKKDLWRDNVRVPIVYFGKVSKVPKKLKEELEKNFPGILAGKTIMPLRLTKIRSVVTKMRGKPQSKVKRNYYTEGQADKVKENYIRANERPPDYRPRETTADDLSLMSEDDIAKELEGLEDILVITDYKGEFKEREEFEPDSVRVTELGKAS